MAESILEKQMQKRADADLANQGVEVQKDVVTGVPREPKPNSEVPKTQQTGNTARVDLTSVFAIMNNTLGTLIISDLKVDRDSAPATLAAPKGGETPEILYIKDIYPEARVRASNGLRKAIKENLVRVLTKEQAQEIENSGVVWDTTLRDQTEAAFGEAIKTRTPAGKISMDLERALEQNAQRQNQFDVALKKVKDSIEREKLGRK